MSDSTPLSLYVKPTLSVEYLLRLILGDKKPGTARGYNTYYRDFNSFALRLGGVQSSEPEATLPALLAILSMDNGAANALVTSWRVDMVARQFAPATINASLSAVRSFVGEAKRFGWTTWTLNVKNVASKSYRDTAGPGHDAYKKMTALAEARGDAKGKRDAALLQLLYSVGLRRKEVAGLDLSDYDPAREWGEGQKGGVKIIQKRDTDATWIGLPANVVTAINAWIECRGSEAGPLFKNLDFTAQNETDGRRLGKAGIFSIVRKYGREAGLSRPVSPHRLRHGGATRAARLTNGNAVAVQAWGRWKSLAVAQLYLDADKNLQATVSEMVAGD